MAKKVKVLFKSPVTERRRKQSARLKRALERLKRDGTSYEQIAVDMRVSIFSIYNWLNGSRLPKFYGLRFFEDKYKVKII